MELRIQAFEIFRSSGGRATTKHIAEQLGIESSKVKYWRTKDKWATKIKRGAPPGNQNAKGNKGGGAPKGNLNGLKHGSYCNASKFLDKGFLSKYIPSATKNIIKGISEEGLKPLDMLWDNIMIAYAAILRSQKIMHVTSKSEIAKELKKTEVSPGKWGDAEKEEYEIQFAWDRQERFLKAQSTAMGTLSNMIKQYEELLHKNWDLATEEQKARIEVLKAKFETKEIEPVKITFVKASEKDG
ncbi:MAG: phage terminase small subunit [Clostridium sp.]